MAGMRQARHIVAVNTDPEARIFQIAHDPICADLYEVIPRLMELEGMDRPSVGNFA